MGVAATAGIALQPLFRVRHPGREALCAYAVIIFFAALFLFVAVQRMASGLRENESYAATMALRFASGGPLFPRPEEMPIGTIYTPVFIIVCGILFKIIPSIYVCGRLITIAATVLSAVYVYRTAGCLFPEKNSGLWAAALFSATYGIMSQSYDWLLADPLCMCLCAASVFHFVRDRRFDCCLALFLAGLACCTKQPALFLFAAEAVYALVKRRYRTVFGVLAFWAAAAGLLVLLSNGWAWNYLVRMPSRHGFRLPPAALLVRFIVLQLPLWIGVGYALWKRNLPVRFLVVFGALACSGLFGIVKAGGWINALFCAEPVLCAAGAGLLRQRRPLLVAQLVIGLYNPFAALYPWSTIHAARIRAVAAARSVTGDVWFPMEPYLAYESGKTEWDCYAALEADLWNGDDPPRRLLDAINNRAFDRIIICTKSDFLFWAVHPALTDAIRKNYMKMLDPNIIIYRPIVPRQPAVLAMMDH